MSLVVPVETLSDGLKLGSQLLRVCLIASALLLCKGCEVEGVQSPYALVYTAEGVPEDVVSELSQVRAALAAASGPVPIEIEGLAGSELWASWIRGGNSQPLVRTGVAPKDLGRWLVEVAPHLGTAPFIADIATGMVYTRGVQSGLRAPAEKLRGYSVVVAGDQPTDGRWGRAPEAIDIMRELKGKWDPAGTFNPAAFR